MVLQNSFELTRKPRLLWKIFQIYFITLKREEIVLNFAELSFLELLLINLFDSRFDNMLNIFCIMNFYWQKKTINDTLFRILTIIMKLLDRILKFYYNGKVKSNRSLR